MSGSTIATIYGSAPRNAWDGTEKIPLDVGGADGVGLVSALATSIALGAVALAGGTITTSKPMTLTQTWNAGGVTFNALLVNVTSTASAAASTLLDLQVAGASQFKVDTSGNIIIPTTSALCSSNELRFKSGSTEVAELNGYGFGIGLTYAFNWQNIGLAPDLFLYRDAAGILAQRNGVNAQALRIYNTYTDASNYERGVFDWGTTSNVLTIGTQKAGTGSTRAIDFVIGGTAQLQIDTSGNLVSGGYIQGYTGFRLTSPGGAQLWVTSAFGDDFGYFNGAAGGGGHSGLTVASTGAFSFASGATTATSPDTSIVRDAAGILGIRNGSTGGAALSLIEQTAPAAPAANGCYLYAVDNGGGKTQLMALFSCGAAQQVAIQP